MTDLSRSKTDDVKQATSEKTLLGLYLRPCAQIICFATHSKLGLTSFVEILRNRQLYLHQAVNQQSEIIDGGVIGLPVYWHMPPHLDDQCPPSRMIILHHDQDWAELLHQLGKALLAHFSQAEILFHPAGEPLE